MYIPVHVQHSLLSTLRNNYRYTVTAHPKIDTEPDIAHIYHLITT